MSDEQTRDVNYGHCYRTVLEFHIEAEVIPGPMDQPAEAEVSQDLNAHCPGPGFMVLTAFRGAAEGREDA